MGLDKLYYLCTLCGPICPRGEAGTWHDSYQAGKRSSPTDATTSGKTSIYSYL